MRITKKASLQALIKTAENAGRVEHRNLEEKVTDTILIPEQPRIDISLTFYNRENHLTMYSS